MPGAKTARPAVTTRLLAPEAARTPTDGLLYRPVPQLDGAPPFKVSYPWISPVQAKEMLFHAATAGSFKQRKLRMAEVRRWKNLIRTDRFVHFLPNGVLCYDEDGVLLNGQHRLNGVADGDRDCGFVVFRNVPRWMFAFFDTNKARTIKDVFHIGQRVAGPQTDSAVKLALRYEEFLLGARSGHGWRHWNSVKDEHQDVDDFLVRREELQDWYGVAEKVYRFSKLLIPAGMTFRFYQSLAWPEGDDQIQEFCEQLVNGSTLNATSPPIQLRKFTRTAFENKTPFIAKREVHLLLMMRAFTQFMNKTRIESIVWAYGYPMVMPYHPKGFEVAVKNVRTALDELDAEKST